MHMWVTGNKLQNEIPLYTALHYILLTSNSATIVITNCPCSSIMTDGHKWQTHHQWVQIQIHQTVVLSPLDGIALHQ